MHSSYCLFLFIVFLHNATPKVYVIDLTDEGNGNGDVIQLRDLLQLFKKNAELDRKQKSRSNDDCFVSLLSDSQKVTCLERKRGKNVRASPKPYSRLKRKIYSLLNHGGLNKQPFTDLTRDEFSQDYLDIGELSRNENCYYPECLTGPQGYNNLNYIYKRLRRNSRSDTQDSSSERRKGRRERKLRKRNRFQVVLNSDSSSESEEEKPHKSFSSESEEKERRIKSSSGSDETKQERDNSDSESVEVLQRPKSKEKFAYLQGNKVYDNLRRRLQHFLPKRHYWNDDDMHHLGYYWFDGPRGKYT